MKLEDNTSIIRNIIVSSKSETKNPKPCFPPDKNTKQPK